MPYTDGRQKSPAMVIAPSLLLLVPFPGNHTFLLALNSGAALLVGSLF